jgi:peptide/nickel transport system permease protein
MLKYLLNRLFWSFITLWCISLITFGLSKCSGSDPDLSMQFADGGAFNQSVEIQSAAIIDKAKALGQDKPPFYITLSMAALPDTFYKVFPLDRRKYLSAITQRSGDWDAVARFEKAKNNLFLQIVQIPAAVAVQNICIREYSLLSVSTRLDTLGPLFSRLHQAGDSLPELRTGIERLEVAVEDIVTNPKWVNTWLPALYWNGFDNQYHHWLIGFLTGNWGETRIMHRPIWQELKPALYSTMIVNTTAILLAYLLAIPLGMYMARRVGKNIDRWWRRILMFLYAMPSFWLGGLMILFFATPDAGLSLITTFSMSPLQDSGKYALAWFIESTPVILLPVCTLGLHILAVIALQMRDSILLVMDQDYIRTARSKGLDEDQVYWEHAYRNALFPLITLFAQILPAAFVGSIVLETLFPYYGMGRKIMDAISDHDQKMLLTILMLTSSITILANLIADLMYRRANPTVRFAKDE